MGFLTTITIRNDALHSFQKDPKQFAERIFDAMNEANCSRQAADASFVLENCSYGGYITVEPSRHADDETVYLHSGNGVFNLNPWNEDFTSLLARNPEHAADLVKRAERILKECKDKIKQAKASKP